MESQAENIRRKAPTTQRPHLQKNHNPDRTGLSAPPDPFEFSNSYSETAAADYTNFPYKIYENLIFEIQAVYKSQIYFIALKTTVRTMISRIQNDISTKDLQMMAKPPSTDLSGELPMMRQYSVRTIEGELPQFILWAIDDTLSLLRFNGLFFIDATFLVVPAPFVTSDPPKTVKKYTDSQYCFLLFGMLSLLSKVTTEDIENSLNLVKEKIQANINFEPFQTYFNKTWMQKFYPNLSNTIEIKEEFDLSLKTNNALERYNRRLGECFFASHPNIAAFVNTIKNVFVYVSSEMIERRKCGKGIKWRQIPHEDSELLDEFNSENARAY
ncbi:hypothetical protein HZS_1346 [Henneguya salminicola]|nr:hypothetical protein HZS_1346 [Henneguya salminicola]